MVPFYSPYFKYLKTGQKRISALTAYDCSGSPLYQTLCYFNTYLDDRQCRCHIRGAVAARDKEDWDVAQEHCTLTAEGVFSYVNIILRTLLRTKTVRSYSRSGNGHNMEPRRNCVPSQHVEATTASRSTPSRQCAHKFILDLSVRVHWVLGGGVGWMGWGLGSFHFLQRGGLRRSVSFRAERDQAKSKRQKYIISSCSMSVIQSYRYFASSDYIKLYRVKFW